MAKFELGKIVVTPSVLQAVSETDQIIALNNHVNGLWGSVSEDDRQANDNAVKFKSGRIMSVYQCSTGQIMWIITEPGRTTTLLFPEEA